MHTTKENTDCKNAKPTFHLNTFMSDRSKWWALWTAQVQLVR